MHEECVFPFTYYGVTYDTCTDVGENGEGNRDYTWCSTEKEFVVGSGNYRKCEGCAPSAVNPEAN